MNTQLKGLRSGRVGHDHAGVYRMLTEVARFLGAPETFSLFAKGSYD